MRYQPWALRFLLASGLLLAASGAGGQAARPPAEAWRAANLAWLRGQVAPNRAVPDPNPARRRLVVSYDVSPEQFPQGYHRSYIYDDALAVLAFFVTGEQDAAALTLHELGRLLRSDGSLWFSYNTADSWPDEQDHESAMVRAGAVSWVGYAFTFYLSHAPPCAPADAGCTRERAFFRESASKLGNYLLSIQVDDSADRRSGLIRLGYGTLELAYRAESDEIAEIYLEEPAWGISTENNISAWFFLRQLARLTGEDRWSQAAERIRLGLLRSAWNDELGQFNRGFRPGGAPDPVKALDCASWGALFLEAAGETEKAKRALAVIDTYYAARQGEARGYRPYDDFPVFKRAEVGAFFYPEEPGKQWRDLPLVWSEGTLGVALAHLRLGDSERAREIVAGLQPLQVEGSGLRYASLEVPYQMADAPSVAASAWLVLVGEMLAGNPVAIEFWQ